SDFDAAGRLAEQRLGMSSLTAHGAHDVAPFMPAGMQTMGTDMHHAASQFAVAAQDAAVTGDLGRALAALARVNRTCVACHAAYRLE
ncbi:MAG TPA: cytochrome c, partial [Ottowia sp.]|nr:cytochrome c [Ottowia sp.]